MGNEIKTPSGTNAAPGATTPPKTFKNKEASPKGSGSAGANKGPQAAVGDSFAKGEQVPKAPGATHTHAAGPSVQPPSGNGGGVSTRGGLDPKVTAQAEPKADATSKGDASEQTKAGGAPPESELGGLPYSGYDLHPLPNGEFRLTRPGTDLSYLIQIFPNAKLDSTNQKAVGNIIGHLLKLIELEQEHHGGVKSVTYSGNSGQLVYNNHPDGDTPVAFGGDSKLLNISGIEIQNLLKLLEKHLGKGLGVTLNSDPAKNAAEKAAAEKAAAEEKASHKAAAEKAAAETKADKRPAADAARATSDA